ncbi:acetolactate decarboxylase [Candidatus Aerophobetes bacterium]|uniref:Alpha-acetolactate decarboxylase n=1 Tax=Aerophobetes bacterium TaxID=2030807 RepID=A0A2A4YG76_UNCAE|nr:MAG: acetolactate decarboxylase [Candidatus Aerophobetes bacterium]
MKSFATSLIILCMSFTPLVAKQQRAHKVFQVSTFSALLNGVYDGEFKVKRLREFGDFGLGIVNNLDGELIAVQGEYYHIDPKGYLKPAKARLLTPFASVCFFEPQKTFMVRNIKDINALQETLEDKFYNVNVPYAFRIDGTFPRIKLRSLKPQSKPFIKFAEAVKDQYVFELENVKGSLVAFWYPMYLSGINVPILHMHFASEDRKRGGHVLNIELNTATVKMMELNNIEIQLPSTRSFAKADLEGDHTHTIKRVESRN